MCPQGQTILGAIADLAAIHGNQISGAECLSRKPEHDVSTRIWHPVGLSDRGEADADAEEAWDTF